MIKNIAAIIFDLDGTLYNENIAYDSALKKVGLSLKNARYQQARRQVKTNLKNHVSARNRFLYFKQLLENSRKYSPYSLMKMVDQYEKALSANVTKQWRRLHREELIRKLASRYRLLILSNENTRTQMIKVNAMDPRAKFFNALITSEEVGFEKPNTRMFKIALTRLNLPPQKCLVVGDNFKTDIFPAQRLGFHTVLTQEFNNQSASHFPIKVQTIRKLDQLTNLLRV